MLNLKSVRDEELLDQLTRLVKQSRGVEADVVAHIGEVERRRLYAREACSSMFEYCRRILGLRENEAYLRITVARVARLHPTVLEMLGDGRLHLSGIARLAPHLTRGSAGAVLERACGLSHREVRELVAELDPRPDVAASVRKLPERTLPVGRPQLLGPQVLGPQLLGPQLFGPQLLGPQLLGPQVLGSQVLGSQGLGPQLLGSQVHEPRECSTPERVAACGDPAPQLGAPRVESEAVNLNCDRPLELDHADEGRDAAAPPPRAAAPPRAALVEPLAPGRYQVRFTASAELREKLERLQALMRSSVPDGDLARIIDIAVSEKLQRAEAKRFGRTTAPRSQPVDVETTPSSRHIPAAVRRLVHARDGGRCAYRDRSGLRCARRHDLEFHHRRPFAHGGDHGPANLALMCRAHNTLLAEQDYGEDVMARFRAATGRATGPVDVHGTRIALQLGRDSSDSHG